MADDLDVANITSWDGRPKRLRGPPPKTYWEEFVETDMWYQRKLFEDIPADEMWAAVEDDDLDDVGEEGDDEIEEEEEDAEYESEIPSEECDDESDTASDSSSEATTETSTEVHGSGEGQ